MNFRSVSGISTLAAFAALLGVVTQGASCADVTVVSNVTVSGVFTPTQHEGAYPMIPFPQGDVTTYYHGELERIEAAGSVTLFDTAKDRVTIINSKSKS